MTEEIALRIVTHFYTKTRKLNKRKYTTSFRVEAAPEGETPRLFKHITFETTSKKEGELMAAWAAQGLAFILQNKLQEKDGND